MNVFEFENYKDFVNQELAHRPKKGRGEFMKLSKFLRVHTTMITHIFRGDHHLSQEHGLAVAEYLGLNTLETEYFMALIGFARAGDERTRKFYRGKIREVKDKSLALRHRLEFKNKLEESDQAIFYSSWLYAAARLMTMMSGMNTSSTLAEKLGVSANQINAVLEFLLSRGLVEKTGNTFKYRDLSTYVARDSVLASRHNVNWRLKCLERLDRVAQNEMAYTNPIVIAETDFERVTELIVQFIAEFRRIADPSPSEILCCLNIDWLKLVTV